MGIKVCGDFNNPKNFVIITKNHENTIYKYYSDFKNQYTDYFYAVDTFRFTQNALNKLKSIMKYRNAILLAVPYFDYSRIGEKMRAIRESYDNIDLYVEIEDLDEFFDDILSDVFWASLMKHKINMTEPKAEIDYEEEYNKVKQQLEYYKSEQYKEEVTNEIKNDYETKVYHLNQEIETQYEMIRYITSDDYEQEIIKNKIHELNLITPENLENKLNDERNLFNEKYNELQNEYLNTIPKFNKEFTTIKTKLSYSDMKNEYLYDITDKNLHEIFLDAINTNLKNVPIIKVKYQNKNIQLAHHYKITVNNLTNSKIYRLYEHLQNILVSYYEHRVYSARKINILKNPKEHIKLTHAPDISFTLTDNSLIINFGWLPETPMYKYTNTNNIMTDYFDPLHKFKEKEGAEIDWYIRLFRTNYVERMFYGREKRNVDIEAEFIEENKCMIYVSLFDDEHNIKIGRSENWVHRKNQYYFDKEIKKNMLLAWWMYVPEHHDIEITKYIMYCMEDKLKQLANKEYESLTGKEYFTGQGPEKSNIFLQEVKNTMENMSIKEILNLRNESKIKEYANSNKRNYEEVVRILT